MTEAEKALGAFIGALVGVFCMSVMIGGLIYNAGAGEIVITIPPHSWPPAWLSPAAIRLDSNILRFLRSNKNIMCNNIS
jgi:hypothetical protein